MPTGYTAAVVDGSITELRDFAMQCARGMGALIMMRDEPHDAPIPERFEPSDYYAKKLAEAKAERERLYAMSVAEVEAAAHNEYAEKCAAKAEWEAQRKLKRERYNAMIEKVQDWQGAPEGIKTFMLEQLVQGRDFDCGGSYYNDPGDEPMSGADWKHERLNKVEHDIQYHAAEDAKERERVEGRNRWLAQLRASLP